MSRLRLFVTLNVLEGDSGTDLLADKARVEKTVEAFLSAPALEAIGMVKVDNHKPKKITPATRAGLAAKGKKVRVEYFDHEMPDRQAWAQFSMYTGMIEISSVVERAELEKHRATALDDLIAAVTRTVELWDGIASVSEGFIKFESTSAIDPPYARLRKPRSSMRYPQRSLVTFLHPRHPRRADEVSALTDPPPAHATMTKLGELVLVRWPKTLDDGDVAQASTWHDCWIRRVETDVDHMWTDAGDERILAGNGKPCPPLTFYNPWWKRGFKAVPITPNGALEPLAWDEACQVLKAGVIRLEDGTEDKVERLWIVVQTREQAIAVHERVVAAGFESALYPDPIRSSDYCDPVPKGPWLTESTDNGKPRS